MAAYAGIKGGTGTSATANATIDRFIPARTLEVAKYTTGLYNLASKVAIPQGESQTVTFVRWPHLGMPTSPLAEADSGKATAMTTERVTCVTEAWGAYVAISSLGHYITRGSPADIAAERLGVQSARVIDREIIRQLMGGTTVYYPSTYTAPSITANDTITTSLMRKVRARMKRTGARSTRATATRSCAGRKCRPTCPLLNHTPVFSVKMPLSTLLRYGIHITGKFFS